MSVVKFCKLRKWSRSTNCHMVTAIQISVRLCVQYNTLSIWSDLRSTNVKKTKQSAGYTEAAKELPWSTHCIYVHLPRSVDSSLSIVLSSVAQLWQSFGRGRLTCVRGKIVQNSKYHFRIQRVTEDWELTVVCETVRTCLFEDVFFEKCFQLILNNFYGYIINNFAKAIDVNKALRFNLCSYSSCTDLYWTSWR